MIAKALSAAIPLSRLENRGQRTLAALMAKARRLHFIRICTIHDGQGKPQTISFLSLGSEKGWDRLSPKIRINKVIALPKHGGKCAFPQSRCLSISGTRAKTLRMLLSPCNTEGAAESEMNASAKKISISAGNKKLLELGVLYEK